MEIEEKAALLDGYSQSILGYVVRWVDQGVGCSSVPDRDGIYLMEDRATLRIGSQLLENWLVHGVISEENLLQSFTKMAAEFDKQNVGDERYTPLAGNFDGPAFQTSLQLVLEGTKAKSGYVEDALHEARREMKANGAFKGGDIASYVITSPSVSPSAPATALVGEDMQKQVGVI